MSGEKTLWIVSNRLPVTVSTRNGGYEFKKSSGGLASALQVIKSFDNVKLLGWAGPVKNDEKWINKLKKEYNCIPVLIPKKLFEGYYKGFSNRAVWPLFHYLPAKTGFEENDWKAYKKVNEIFANIISSNAKDGDTIWIHDYHLLLLPSMIRKMLPNSSVGFFLHIPFPSAEVFRILPWRQEILEGMLGADLLGFHTYDYARHFRSSLLRILGLKSSIDKVQYKDRKIGIGVFPMGIDVDTFSQEKVEGREIQKEIDRWRTIIGNRKIILGVDRLDITKGIPQRLLAFERLLSNNKDIRKKIILIQLTVPSREGVAGFKELKKDIDQLVGKIEGEFGAPDAVPIHYIYHSVPKDKLIALYRMADVMLVTSLRDGMNLVAKEYIAAKKDLSGVLVLSEFAGAASELGEALKVNPWNIEEVSKALATALQMDDDEKRHKMNIMYQRLKRHDIFNWTNQFLEETDRRRRHKEKVVPFISSKDIKKIRDNYARSRKSLFLLDCDESVFNIYDNFQAVFPVKKLINTLNEFSASGANNIFLLSGRDKDLLHKLFGHYNVGLCAESGCWIKYADKPKWKCIKETGTLKWKKRVKEIFDEYADRTPGSYVDERDYSLLWDYRFTDPEFGEWQAKEIISNLEEALSKVPVDVIPGKKSIEVRPQGINKGSAALKIIKDSGPYDFIFAAGDNITDEEIFRNLPKKSWSLRVGKGPTKAMFHTDSTEHLLEIMKIICENGNMVTEEEQR